MTSSEYSADQNAASSQSLEWLLAQLKPGGLETARRNLDRQRLACFMPLRKETVKRGGRFLDRKVPLFPGYLFVGVPGQARWQPVRNTLGVARLVCSAGDLPARVPPGLIELLVRRCDADGVVREEDPVGIDENVRISRGPMHDLVARVESLDGPGRVAVLMEFMGRSVRADLPRDHLEPVGGSRPAK